MFHQIMTLNNKKLGLTFRPTNHSHLLHLHVFMVGLPTLLSEKAKGCLKSVYRENTFGRSMYLLYQQYYSVHLGQCCQDSTVQQFKVKV
jgi:hypothetical protein